MLIAFYPGPGDLLIMALTWIVFFAVIYGVVRMAVRRNGGPKNCPHCGAKLRD